MSMPPMEAPSRGWPASVVASSSPGTAAPGPLIRMVGCSAGRGVGIAGAGDSCDLPRRGFEVATVDVGGRSRDA